MFKIIAILILALCPSFSHAAGLIITDASGTAATTGLSAIPGYSGTQTGTFGSLATTVNGTVTYTFLGSEAGFTNTAGTSTTSYTSFMNQNAVYFGLAPTPVGTSVAVTTGVGQLDFGFRTIYPASYSGTVTNGISYNSSATSSFIIFAGGTIKGVKYDYILGYNDPFKGTPDYNDMVIGVNFVSAVPEPKDYALFLTGLLCVALAIYARRKRLKTMKKVQITPSMMLLFMLTSAFALALCTGCENKNPGSTQVLAKVNSDEITVHQMTRALGRISKKEISKKDQELLLEKMVDRQLLLQQAKSLKLDRRPEVMALIEDARFEIMVAAYMEELSTKLPPISDAAVSKYYNDHSHLFAQRKVYRLREITIQEEKEKNASQIEEIFTRLKSKERISDVVAWLSSKPGRFTDQIIIHPSEELPIDVSERFAGLKQGDVFPNRLPDGVVIYEIQGFEAAPVILAAATPSIKAFLKNQQVTAAVNEEIKKLRSSAKISKKSP